MNEVFVLLLLFAFYLAAYVGFDRNARSFDVERVKRVVTLQGGVKATMPTLNRLLALTCLSALLLGHQYVDQFAATGVLLIVHAAYSFSQFYGSSKLPSDIQAATKTRSGQLHLAAWACGSAALAMVWLLPPSYLSVVGVLGLVHFFGMEMDGNFRFQEVHPAAYFPALMFLWGLYRSR